MGSPAKAKRSNPSNSEDEVNEPHLAKRQHTSATTTTPVIVPASSSAVNDPATTPAPASLPALSEHVVDLTAATTEHIALDAPITTAQRFKALGITFARNNTSSGTISIPLAAIKFIQKSADTETSDCTNIAMQQIFTAIRDSPKVVDIAIISSFSNLKFTICAQEDWTFAKVISELKRIRARVGLTVSLRGTKVDDSLTVGEWVSQGKPELFAVHEKFWKT